MQGLAETATHQALQFFKDNCSFELECGNALSQMLISYKTYGFFRGNNAILVCHHLTGDCLVTHNNNNAINSTLGWWQDMVGPGCILDTNKYFIICANVLGGCYGSTGPHSINPITNQPYRLTFPTITIRDMVQAQFRLIKHHLKINKIHTVIGPSMGGMLAFEWAMMYPSYVNQIIVLAAHAKQTPLGIGLSEMSKLALMNDPSWNNGNYTEQPNRGLALARYPLLLACKNFDKNYFFASTQKKYPTIF